MHGSLRGIKPCSRLKEEDLFRLENIFLTELYKLIGNSKNQAKQLLYIESVYDNMFNMILISMMVLCTQVNKMYVIEINIILLDYIGIEGTRLSSEISYTRTDLTA